MQNNRTTLSMKKSTKLPKLTIQQQIDNQQIIQRMNRKITFTKNPRHLNQTLSYTKAFDKSENKQQSSFVIEPVQLLFTQYEINHIYQSEVQIINHSKHIQRIKIAPLKNKQFVIAKVKYPVQGTGDIAPGMHASLFIRFRPSSLHDYEEQITIIVSDGILKIPIIAQRQKCEIKWPTIIDCGHCWVGDTINIKQVVKNFGGQAQFCILDVDNNEESIKKGCFTITPTTLKLKKNQSSHFKIQFKPNKQGNYCQKIKLRSDQQQNQITIQLKGGAYSANLSIDSINNIKQLEQKISNKIYLHNCQIGIPNSSTVSIKNQAVVDVDYCWYTEDSKLLIDKPQGKMKSAQKTQFTITYLPQQRQPKQLQLTLYLFNLPQQSLTNMLNTKTKIINGIKAIQCLTFYIQTNPKESQLKITPLHQQIQQKLYINNSITVEICIENNSQSCRSFTIRKISDHKFLETQCQLPTYQLAENSSINIPFIYTIKQLTKEKCQCWYLIEFDNRQSQLISITGNVSYPTVKLSTNQIFYGLCRTFTANTIKMQITNQGLNDVFIKFKNEFKYYELDFYDFYEFQSEQFYQKRLSIVQQIDEEQDGWIRIQKKSKISTSFILNTMNSEDIELQTLMQIKDGQTIPILIKAFVKQINLALNNNAIKLKQIYKGNVYNSNKFLKKQLAIYNQGLIKGYYEIKYQQSQLCHIKIQPESGIIDPKKKQRLDLLLQPNKTGQLEINMTIMFYDNVQLHPQKSEQNNCITQKILPAKKQLVSTNKLSIKASIRGIQIGYYLKDQTKVKRVRLKMNEDGSSSVKHSTISSKSITKTYIQTEKLIYPNLQNLQFYNCEINQVKQLEIIIQNLSDLTTQYQISAENFSTLQKIDSNTKRSSKGFIGTEQQPFNSEMGKTFIKNRLLHKSQKVHLSNNKGISILCQPSSGSLHKKQSQKILLTMFNDTSGRFQDQLLISIKDHQIKKIPIDIHIKGIPISLSRNQLGIDFKNEIPVMNLGCFLRNNGNNKKILKIVNNGPKDIQINWLLYPYNKIQKDKDFVELAFEQSAPGSQNLLNIKWNAIKPEIDSNPPFIIEPKNKILKGRQQFSFTIIVKQLNMIGTFENLLIAEPSLINYRKPQQLGSSMSIKLADKNKMQIAQRIPMQNLAVVINAQSIQPSLHIDRKHENHINKLELCAIQPSIQTQTKALNSFRKIKLKNTFRTNIGFSLSINSDIFKIVSTETNSTIGLQNKTSMFKGVQTNFLLAFDTYIQIGIQLCCNPKDQKTWPMQKSIHKEEILKIQFSNGEIQKVNLVGWLYRPFIEILMPNQQNYSSQNFEIDFGIVHVKNHKKSCIYLSNPTKSIAKWSISYLKYHQLKYKFQQALWTDQDKQDQNIKDQKKCFKLSLDEGIMQPNTIPIHFMPTTLALASNDDKYAQTHKPIKIDILFKPQENILYKSRFRVNVEEGPYFDIVVKGRGTYEQQYQKKL